MGLNRFLAYLIGCVALASSLLIYMTFINGLGFPDGFITELGYAERKLAGIFIGLNIISGPYFLFLGMVAKKKPIGNKLLAAIALYSIFIIGISLVDYYFRLHLMGGGGG